MKKYIFTLLSVLPVLFSCSREMPAASDASVTVIEAVAPEINKTALAEDGLQPRWSVGDKIKVNNVNSVALKAEDIAEDGLSARFSFNEVLNAPYCGVYSAAVAYGFVEGENPRYSLALNQNEGIQTWKQGTYDPLYSVMYGISQTPQISFSHAMAYLKITPQAAEGGETADITSVRVASRNSEGSEWMSGSFYIHLQDGSLTEFKNDMAEVTMTAGSGASLDEPFIIAIPPQDYTRGVSVRITNEDGAYMDKNIKAFKAVAGTIYPLSAAFVPTGVLAPVAEPVAVTSSTATFGWQRCKAAADDIALAWTVALYADEACTEQIVARTIPAGSAIWKNQRPKFCFGGLSQNTTYWFRVTQEGQDNWSEAVSATTSTFDLTTVASDAAVGDVILAEDFHASTEGGEGTVVAAAYGTVAKALKSGTDSYTLSSATNWAGFESTSFGNWGAYRPSGTANFYLQQGHIKLGTGSAQTYLVTPELSAIPAGKVASVRVEVTASAYVDDAGRVKEGIVSVESGSLNAGHFLTPTTTAFANSATFDMSADNRSWTTYAVELDNVSAASRLMIGSSTPTGNYRFNVSDVKVTVTALEDEPGITATRTDLTSTTVTFTWNQGESKYVDLPHSYKFGIYSDKSCTSPVQEFTSTPVPGSDSTYGNDPMKNNNELSKFIFAGLSPSTAYWFKVQDLTDRTTSLAVPFTTSAAFGCKTLSDVSSSDVISAVGAGNAIVILAEDFSEFRWGADAVNLATGADAPSSPSSFSDAPSSTLKNFSNSGGNVFTKSPSALAASRLSDWAVFKYSSNGNPWLRPGCIQISNANDACYVLTPELKNIPDGYCAEIQVDITLVRYPGAVSSAIVGVCAASVTGNTASVEESALSELTTISGLVERQRKTFSHSFSGVLPTDRIIVGPPTANKSSKSRVIYDDIKVTVLSLTPIE